MSLAEYLQLLEWTGRQLKPGKLGSVPKTAPLILDRLNMSPELWLHAVERFAKRRAVNRLPPLHDSTRRQSSTYDQRQSGVRGNHAENLERKSGCSSQLGWPGCLPLANVNPRRIAGITGWQLPPLSF